MKETWNKFHNTCFKIKKKSQEAYISILENPFGWWMLKGKSKNEK